MVKEKNKENQNYQKFEYESIIYNLKKRLIAFGDHGGYWFQEDLGM